MRTELRELLEFLDASTDPELQAGISARYRKALGWEPVDRPPVIFQYPVPAQGRFRPFPHREVFDDPEKMLFNELVHAFGAGAAFHGQVRDDMPYTVRANFGNQALYFVAALSGLTDMDAITLSTAQLIKKRQLDVDTGWRMILIGAMSNLVFKCGAVALLGHRRMLLRVAIVFGSSLIFGGLLLAFWP